MEEFYLSEDDEILLNKKFEIIENNKKLTYMLFHSLTSIFPMIRYEEELKKINDYIYYNNQTLVNILNEKEKALEDVKNDNKHGRCYGETIDFVENEKLSWEYLIKETNKCNNIVLLLSFLEGVLKEIFEWFLEEKKYISVERKSNEGRIEYYIKEIGNCCTYELYKNLEKEIKVVNIARKIRNIFVHEWDAYYNIKNNMTLNEKLNNMKITNLIDSISRIIYMCEYAGIEGKILEMDDNNIAACFIAERIERIKRQINNNDEDCLQNILKKYYSEEEYCDT